MLHQLINIYISFEIKMLDNDDFMEQIKFISAKYENKKWLFIYYKDKRPYLHLKYNVDKITEIYLLMLIRCELCLFKEIKKNK